YIYLSPEKSHQLVFELASLINQKIAQGEIKKPEIIIGIARGALAWLKTLADWLNIDQINIFRIVHYAGVSKTLKKPKILESNLPRIDKKRVLLFDNIVETGKTMKLAVNYLSICGAEDVTTAVLFYRKHSILTPDFYTIKTEPWIVFHHEIVESIKCLGIRWLNKGLKLEKIKERFLTIGLPQKEVKEAMRIIFNLQS
ncbi:unnamed protein product, partial [marine sediment metagenome]